MLNLQDLHSDFDEEENGGNEKKKVKVISYFSDIYERRKASITQAYMLVYLRVDMRERILTQPPLDEIPRSLRCIFDSENAIVDDMQRELEVHNECGVVYLLTQEIIQDQFYNEETKTVNLPLSLPYNNSFLGNPNMRLKIKMQMGSKVQDLISKIR